MNDKWLIFNGGTQIQIILDTNEPQRTAAPILNACSLKSHWLLLVTENHDLYEGHFDEKNSRILLRYQESNIKDVRFCKNLSRLYVITSDGEAFFQNLTENSAKLSKQWTKIIFDPLELSEVGVVIKRVACSLGGVLFISQKGEVYALGDYGNQQNVDYDQPKLLRMFKCSDSIIDVSAGEEFFVFLTRKFVKHSMYYSNEKEIADMKRGIVSNHASSQTNVNQKEMQSIVDLGASLLDTAVYTLGSSNEGRLGTGDFVKRDTAYHVDKLSAIGVCTVSAGREHSITLSLDGRLFQWGLNDHQQLIDCTDNVLSSPKELCETVSKNICAACCGDYSTILLNSKGELTEKGILIHNQDNLNEGPQIQITDECPLILIAGQLIIYNIRYFKIVYQPSYNHLQEQIRILINLFKQFQQFNKFLHKIYTELKSICHYLQTTIYLLIAILHNFHKYYCGHFTNPLDLIFIKYRNECIEIFEIYTKAYCDVYAVDGFKKAEQTLNPVNEFGQESKYKNFLKMFQQPFQIFPYIIQILDQFSRVDTNFIVGDHLLAWENFVRQTRIELELAENTREFWNNNASNIKVHQFKKNDRRVILTSTAVPLRQSYPISLTTPMIILFSDCLTQVSNHVNVFPLVALWLKREENGIRVITPEKNFLLTARNKHDENLWYDQLESSIKVALKLDENTEKLPEMRCIEYSFTNHSSRGITAKGNFSNGVMHGKCYLEYPDGKLFAGDLVHGEIEGYGYMYIPTVGFYRGEFRAGKFWGYGKLMMNETDMYEGNFRNGVFHGHGHLKQNNCIYIGEFQNNQKCGYGVFDDSTNGHKYLGMFLDNKRVGNGIYVTSMGDYFEGSFANDEMIGKGYAIFQNCSYYEGELTITGPNGMGKYCMPYISPLRKQEPTLALQDCNETENFQVNGTTLSGQLSGHWGNILIKMGTMEMNCTFPKYPRSVGTYAIPNNKKWLSLFSNFETELFGDLTKTLLPDKALTYALWNRVLAFIERQQELSNNKFISDDLHIFHRVCLKSNKSNQYFEEISLNMDKFSLDENLSIQKFELGRLTHSQSSLHRVDSSTNVNINTFHILSKIGHLTTVENNTYAKTNESSTSINEEQSTSLSLDAKMIVIPQFGTSELNSDELQAIIEYLTNAFNYRYHPLYHLNQRIISSFYRSYGCWRVKPTYILAKNAMIEWEYLSQRVYTIVRKLFPVLPEEFCLLNNNKHEMVSHATILYPILLTEGVYSTLFVLYANEYNDKDEIYRLNLLQAEKLTNSTIIKALQLQEDLMPILNTYDFQKAIELLKGLKEKYNPTAILSVIETCVQCITSAYHYIFQEKNVPLNADTFMPLTVLLLLRAAVPHLGAELALLDDLTDTKNFQFEMNGIRGYCYATLKASYEHIATKLLFDQN